MQPSKNSFFRFLRCSSNSHASSSVAISASLKTSTSRMTAVACGSGGGNTSAWVNINLRKVQLHEKATQFLRQPSANFWSGQKIIPVVNSARRQINLVYVAHRN